MSYVLPWIIPIWIGIFFNLVMAIVPSVIPLHSRFARWYFDDWKNFWILMGSVWFFLIAWSIVLVIKGG